MTAGGQPIRILGVPGICNHPDGPAEPGAIADSRAVEWKTRLLKALAAGGQDRLAIQVEIAYYAHHLYRGRPVAHGPGDVTDRLDPDTAQFILDLADMLGLDGPSPQGVSAVRTAVERLSSRFGLDGVQMTRFAERYFPEFSAFLAAPETPARKGARLEVADKINELEPHVVIGHDLGSVVAYEALAADGLVTVTVPLFVTLGSPLGLRWVFERLQPVPAGVTGTWPRAVRCWEDLYDQGDPFAVQRPLGDWFSGGPILDRRLNLGPVHYHADSAYLSCAELGRVLRHHFAAGTAPPPASRDHERQGETRPWPTPPSLTAPIESGTARMPDISLSPEDTIAFRDALVTTFHSADRLEGVLDDIQYPRGRWPAMPDGTKSTERAWRDVFVDLREGALPTGFRSLLATALRRFPHNPVFGDLAGRYAPELLGRGQTPPARPPIARTAASPRVRPDSTPDPPLPAGGLLPDTQVLLVGCTRYPDDPEGLPALPPVGQNLTALADVLADPDIVGVPAGQMIVVCDPDRPQAVMRPLTDVARREAGLLIVYYSGHGIVADGELRLGLTTTTTDTAASGLEGRLLRQEVANSVSGTRLLIADCCFSGRLTNVLADPGSVIEGALDVRGTVTLASSAGDATSLAPPGERLTAFTGEFVDVLRTGLPEKGPLLSVADVFNAVRARMRSKGRPEPRILNTGLASLAPLCKNVSYRGRPGPSSE